MANVDLEQLIQHLQAIHAKYGNMPVEGNVICGERGTIPSLCVINDDDYDEKELTLLIETQAESDGYAQSFSVYEYPSMEDINIDI